MDVVVFSCINFKLALIKQTILDKLRSTPKKIHFKND